MTHPLNVDPYIQQPINAVRTPSRYLSDTSTISNTQPQQRMRARVHYTPNTQSISTGTPTTILWNVVDFDPTGLNKANANAFTVPTTGKITGAWKLIVHVTWDIAAAGYREVNLLSNGSQIASDHHVASNDIQSQNLEITVNDPRPSTIYTVTATQTSGGPLNLLTEPYHTYFEILHLW